MRLFVGIDVPAVIGHVLTAVQPASADGVSLILPPDMHLTLHFLGSCDRAEVETVLANVRVPKFVVTIRGLGSFHLRSGRKILWADVEPAAALDGLYAQVAEVLADTGFAAERRPFRPHVTLARVAHNVSDKTIDALLAAHSEQAFGQFEVGEFVLYDSAIDNGPYRYRRLHRYPLG